MLDMQVTQVYSMFTVTAPTETGLNTQKGRGMEMDTSKSRIGFAFALLAVVAVSGISAKAQAWNDGPSIYSNQGKYLGNLNSNQFDPNSVSNQFGRYGSQFSADSPNNPYGRGVQIYGND